MARNSRKRKTKTTAGNYPAPVWDLYQDEEAMDIDQAKLSKAVQDGFRHYNLKYKAKDAKNWFIQYLKKEKVDATKIKHIKIHYKNDNFKCSKGALTAGLKSYIIMITQKNLSYIDS